MSKTDRFLFRHNAIKHPTRTLPSLSAAFNRTGPLTGQKTRAGPCKGLAHVAQVGSVSLPGAKNMAPVKAYADVQTYMRHLWAYIHKNAHTQTHSYASCLGFPPLRIK